MQGMRHSRSIMIQLLVMTCLVIGLAVYFSDILQMIYFSNQQTSIGYALNGLIVFLFLVGMVRTLMLLSIYNREELALLQLQHNLDQGGLSEGIEPASMIGVRVATMEGMRSLRAPIPHQALAATLLAHESTRTSLIRFIHNILILCGVLGTIVSLSIALFGASSLLEQAVSSTGMGMVIHGMSTALSTTMSAIICYLFLSYFFVSIQNIQTRLLARIEDITATRLLPMYQVTEEAMTQHALDLVKEAHGLVQLLNDKIAAIDPVAVKEEMELGRIQGEQQHGELLGQLGKLSATLKDGFRLPGA